MNRESIIASAAEAAFGTPLLNEVLRSIVSEAIVRSALDGGWVRCPAQWAGFDFQSSHGTRLAVRQSSALQSRQACQGKPSTGKFDIGRRPGFWESATTWVPTPGRNADVYAFAYHPVIDTAVADHRDPVQWEFYIVADARLPRSVRTISVSSIRKLADPVAADGLNDALVRFATAGSTARKAVGEAASLETVVPRTGP